MVIEVSTFKLKRLSENFQVAKMIEFQYAG
jgi:hypothetical protein